MAAEAFAFDVMAPSIVKKGDSVRVTINYPVASGTTTEVYILDPSGRLLPVEIKVSTAVGGRTALSLSYFDFNFGSNGTYIVMVYIEVAPTPDIYTGSCIINVPSWLDNIDAPVSDINKHATEISRLRTTVKKHGSDRSILG